MRTKRIRVTVRNSFHSTEATFYVNEAGLFSDAVYRRVRKTLCGVSGCMCNMPYEISHAIQEVNHYALPDDVCENF